MHKFYKSVEFWAIIPAVYFFPACAIAYTLSRSFMKLGTGALYRPSYKASETYVSLLGVVMSVLGHDLKLAALILAVFTISRGLSKARAIKPHNVKISF